jgi:hypothetical protein
MTDTNSTGLSLEEGMRRWGAVLKLWRLCGNASCRRARACRGDVDRCFAANFPLLPDGVRDFIDGLAEARRGSSPSRRPGRGSMGPRRARPSAIGTWRSRPHLWTIVVIHPKGGEAHDQDCL